MTVDGGNAAPSPGYPPILGPRSTPEMTLSRKTRLLEHRFDSRRAPRLLNYIRTHLRR